MSKSISYIFNDSEISAGTRGSSLGPGAIRVVDDNSGSYLFSKYPIFNVATCNDFLDFPTPYKHGKRIDGMVKLYENITELVSVQRNENDFLVVISGDHGSAGGTVAGLKIANPDNNIGVLWIDAHADLHSPYTTPSGNMHGMPVATILNVDNLECQQNKPTPEEEKMWNQLKNMGGVAPKIPNENLAYIGLRDLEEPEIDFIKRNNITDISVAELREKGTEEIILKLMKQFQFCNEIYVSFDVDSMDPDLTSHGTGTPVPNGITPEEARILLKHFANHPKTRCIEFVEVNPCLDEKKNRMAEIAYDLITDVVTTVEQKSGSR